MKTRHAQALLEKGDVFIPRLVSFRDDSKHRGLIFDRGEGAVTLINHYSFYAGLVKDASGVLPAVKPPYMVAALHDFECQQAFDTGRSLAFCMTQHLFSRSFEWAISEEKDSCVLITHVPEFVSLINAKISAEGRPIVGLESCIYLADENRNVIERDPSPHGISNHLLTHPSLAAFIKPAHYKDQIELRAVWDQPKSEAEYAMMNEPAVREFLLPLEIAEIDREAYLADTDRKDAVGCRIRMKDGRAGVEFRIREPREVCSPVIFTLENGPLMLGFRAEHDRNIEILSLNGPGVDYGLLAGTPIGGIVGCAQMSEVAAIEFFGPIKERVVVPNLLSSRSAENASAHSDASSTGTTEAGQVPGGATVE
ncbi:MAG TPA: hypothetical protein PJ982_14020 [Lacipirellulaceae bacterium]|nr:hypothetical protein [Lacipirellulaceae bacterium]